MESIRLDLGSPGTPLMAGNPIRDPVADHLLAAQNAAMLLIDDVVEILLSERLLKP